VSSEFFSSPFSLLQRNDGKDEEAKEKQINKL
jgi:hypothetical protein